MLRLFRRLALISSVLAIAAASVPAQPDEKEFGWSLTVTPGIRKKPASRFEDGLREQRPPEEGEIRVDTQLVLSDLLVQDKRGVPVSGLTAADFEISEDGRPQKVDVFAYGDSSIPRSIILVIDHSLSQRRHIGRSIAAAKILVDALRPSDRMAIVSDDVALISDFTSEKKILKERLDALESKCAEMRFGKSRQYSALMAALNERIVRNGTRNIIIFQTDGDEFLLLGDRLYAGSGNFGIDQIVTTARRKGVTIYSVFTGTRFTGLSERDRIERSREELIFQTAPFARHAKGPSQAKPVEFAERYLKARIATIQLEEASVASVAERSGGLSQVLESPDQAAAVYERILSDIGQRYSIGYYPPEQRQGPPREREVRISLRNKGNYRVVGGRTYLTY